VWAGHNYTVQISYYGGQDFNISPRNIYHPLHPGDRVTFHTDDQGLLILRLDDGTYRATRSGDIVYTVRELHRTGKVLCSMLLDDGTMLGSEATGSSFYGMGPENPIQYRGSSTENVVIRWLRSLLGF
jgi:hypothetical protein